MLAWPRLEIPRLDVHGPAVSVYDTENRSLVTLPPNDAARMYVCGITPYDSTHLGHAATYVGFDLLNRALRNAGHDVIYVQNVTDIDDPLLERAHARGIPWSDLAQRETERFRQDMTALRVLPPAHFVGVSEAVTKIISRIEMLKERGSIYRVGTDLYFEVSADPSFGRVSSLDRDVMLKDFAERGGDPDRRGKRDPLDCLVWRGERQGEPSWPSPWGPGRPGWHIGCTTIAQEYLGPSFDVQGGGRDLAFPHHEMSAGLGHVIHPQHRFAQTFVHAGMVAYDGEKMSKSRGNLVFVSSLRKQGVDPVAIRLALMRHHYRSSWQWTDAELPAALVTLKQWRRALALGSGAPAAPVEQAVLSALAADLDAPAAVTILQEWVDASLGTDTVADKRDSSAPMTVRRLADASLGLLL